MWQSSAFSSLARSTQHIDNRSTISFTRLSILFSLAFLQNFFLFTLRALAIFAATKLLHLLTFPSFSQLSTSFLLYFSLSYTFTVVVDSHEVSIYASFDYSEQNASRAFASALTFQIHHSQQNNPRRLVLNFERFLLFSVQENQFSNRIASRVKENNF